MSKVAKPDHAKERRPLPFAELRSAARARAAPAGRQAGPQLGWLLQQSRGFALVDPAAAWSFGSADLLLVRMGSGIIPRSASRSSAFSTLPARPAPVAPARRDGADRCPRKEPAPRPRAHEVEVAVVRQARQPALDDQRRGRRDALGLLLRSVFFSRRAQPRSVFLLESAPAIPRARRAGWASVRIARDVPWARRGPCIEQEVITEMGLVGRVTDQNAAVLEAHGAREAILRELLLPGHDRVVRARDALQSAALVAAATSVNARPSSCAASLANGRSSEPTMAERA